MIPMTCEAITLSLTVWPFFAGLGLGAVGCFLYFANTDDTP